MSQSIRGSHRRRHLVTLWAVISMVCLWTVDAFAQSETIDFESGYTVDVTLNGQDNWSHYVEYGYENDFMIRADGSTLLRCAADGPTSMERPFTARTTVTELAWRWRVSSRLRASGVRTRFWRRPGRTILLSSLSC